jgi:hypothetical protein
MTEEEAKKILTDNNYCLTHGVKRVTMFASSAYAVGGWTTGWYSYQACPKCIKDCYSDRRKQIKEARQTLGFIK